MSRDLEPDLVTEITAPVLRPVMLFEAFFDGGTVRFWNGLGELTALGNTYTGSGNLLSVSDFEETQDLNAQGITLTLSGIPSNLLSVALGEDYKSRECNIYIGALDDTNILVSDPYRVFSGFMDVMKIIEGGETSEIQLSAESKAVILTRKKDRRYTPEDQKKDFTGDKGLDFVPLMQDREIIWRAGS